MKPKSKGNSIKTYLFLAIGLITFFLVGGYGFRLFPSEVNFGVVLIGVIISTVFLIFYLKSNDH